MGRIHKILLSVLTTSLAVGGVSLCFQPNAMARNTQTPDAFITAGDQAMSTSNFEEAIRLYGKAAKIDKKNPDNFQRKGKAEYAAQKYKPALSDFNKSIKLNPRDPSGYASRALVWDSLKKFKKERSDLDKVIAVEPTNGPVILQRAQTNLQLNNPKSVLDDCERALPLGLPRDQLAQLYKSKAYAYKKLGKKSESQQEMAKYQSLQP